MADLETTLLEAAGTRFRLVASGARLVSAAFSRVSRRTLVISAG